MLQDSQSKENPLFFFENLNFLFDGGDQNNDNGFQEFQNNLLQLQSFNFFEDVSKKCNNPIIESQIVNFNVEANSHSCFERNPHETKIKHPKDNGLLKHNESQIKEKETQEMKENFNKKKDDISWKHENIKDNASKIRIKPETNFRDTLKPPNFNEENDKFKEIYSSRQNQKLTKMEHSSKLLDNEKNQKLNFEIKQNGKLEANSIQVVQTKREKLKVKEITKSKDNKINPVFCLKPRRILEQIEEEPLINQNKEEKSPVGNKVKDIHKPRINFELKSFYPSKYSSNQHKEDLPIKINKLDFNEQKKLDQPKLKKMEESQQNLKPHFDSEFSEFYRKKELAQKDFDDNLEIKEKKNKEISFGLKTIKNEQQFFELKRPLQENIFQKENISWKPMDNGNQINELPSIKKGNSKKVIRDLEENQIASLERIGERNQNEISIYG